MSSVVNLSNNTVGVGMLAMPMAFANAGLLVGSFAWLCAVVLSSTSSLLLSESTVALGTARSATLSRVVEAATGITGRLLLDILVVFGIGCASTGYLIVVGDSMPSVMAALGFGDGVLFQRETWIMGSIVMIAPLAFLRRIDSLRFASALVLIAAAIISGTVLLFVIFPTRFDAHAGCEHGTSACLGTHALYTDPRRTLDALPILLFVYSSQSIIPAIVCELDRPTPARMLQVVLGANALSTAIFALIAGAGYATFGSLVRSDLLLSYPQTLPLVLARLALAYVCVLSYPCLSYPVPYCLDSLLNALSGGRYGLKQEDVAYSQSLWISDPVHRAFVGLYLFTTCCVALSVSQVGWVIALAGSLSSATLAFITGPLCYLQLVDDEYLRRSGLLPQAIPRCKRAFAAASIAAGCVVTPVLSGLVLGAFD